MRLAIDSSTSSPIPASSGRCDWGCDRSLRVPGRRCCDPEDEDVMTRRFFAALAAVSALTIPSLAGEEPARRLRVVVFGGHPDDPESGAGGLVALLTRQGHEVIL